MRPYTKMRSAWAKAVMSKHFPDWPDWDEQVPIFDVRGLDIDTIETVGIGYFTRIMPRADVIALKPGELLVVEFSSRAVPRDVSKLDSYIESIRNDHVRENWRKRKIRGAFVVPYHESRIEAVCRQKGYLYIVEPQPVIE